MAAAGMLALGIGITAGMLTIVDSLILRPVPFRDPTDRGVLLAPGPHALSRRICALGSEQPGARYWRTPSRRRVVNTNAAV
jgi:hypothetical protein